MATTSSSSNPTPFTDSQPPIQPRRLKDFLQDQNLPFPRPRKSPISLFLHAAVKSSSIFRRRFSAKSKSSSSPEPAMARTTSVTVKDILRWKSFRDLADPADNHAVQPLDFTTESPSRCTVTTATTSSAGTPRSSWSGSDFTVGDSPVWCRGVPGEVEVTDKKNFQFYINVAAAGERIRQKTTDLKDSILNDEEEQFSPISVLDFTQEHEQTYSPFHQILDNMERRNAILKQQIQNFENLIKVDDHCFMNNKHIKSTDIELFKIEERAIQLLDRIKTTSCIESFKECDECLLLDFIRDELITGKGVENNVEFESKILSVMRGQDYGSLEGETGRPKEACIREMDRLVNWKDFEEGEEEIGIEMEKMMLNYLLDELTMELLKV